MREKPGQFVTGWGREKGSRPPVAENIDMAIARPAIPFHRARPLRRALRFLEADMADYFTHFSCVLDVGTPHNAARALYLYPACMEIWANEPV